ncbi:hypothetical protein FRC16_007808 [Serendipita sp. 398]|nr:hypothetical protein FRC16_007808 [Serendipita sp. 398]
MSLIIDKNNSSGEGLQVLEASQHPTSSGAYLGTATINSGEDALEADNCRPVRTVEGTVPSPTTVPSIDIPENRIISHTSLTGKDDTATSGEDESKGRQRTVRFYSRVRITSGVGHSGRSRSAHGEHTLNTGEDREGERIRSSSAVDIVRPIDESPYRSTNASTSTSYSSSISAPLRSSSELPPRPPANHRKPLSNILDSSDANVWLQSLTTERRKRRKRRHRDGVDERSPLLQRPGILRHDPNEAHISVNGHNKSDRFSEDSTGLWKYFTLYYWESRLSALCCCADEQDE